MWGGTILTEAYTSRRADRLRSVQQARGRDRIANIFSATVAETPSFDDVELWTLIDGTPVDGKPNSEKTHVARAKREYDVAVDALSKGLSPLIAGLPVRGSEARTDAFLDACDVASRVAMTGAPVHSVINALNLTLIASGELPVSVPRVAAQIDCENQLVWQARAQRMRFLKRCARHVSGPRWCGPEKECRDSEKSK